MSIVENYKGKGLTLAVILNFALISLFSSISTSAYAMEQADSDVIEEVVTIGTRSKPRSVTQSIAPVDVISGDDFVNQGGIDTSNLLRNVVPSFNVNDQPISDAATLVRPANLRGLAPDHTLVLVNGQRRHRAAVITWLGNGLSDGSQGPDISAIPALALRSIEVLRDGAAAQYGSDAIAGVVNFNLKNDNSGGSFEAKYGSYQEGDGDQYILAVNKGFAIGDNGFLNVTAEWADTEATDRAVQRTDAAALIAAGYQNVGNPAQVWGSPEVADDYKLWANFGANLNDKIEFFGQANYNSKDVLGGFYYRNPTNRGSVYSGDGGATLLIGDLTPGAVGDTNAGFPALSAGDGVSCPTVALTDLVPDAASMALVAADANCFSFQELITGGFTPNFGGEVSDSSLLVGLRGEADNGLEWSISSYWGINRADFVINNTVNASLGPITPRDFKPGYYEQGDHSLNADFSYPVSDALQVSFGAELRTEEFTIGAGQRESYIDGGLGTQGFSTSTNGFPGFSPKIAGSWERENYAAYIDAEFYATEQLLIGAALRFEDFDDFGTTTNYKLGVNWAMSEEVGYRATISTGFKAPTPGQSNASNISTQIIGGVLTNQGVIPASSPAAVLRGSTPLDAEESFHFSIGTYMTIGAFDITMDYFDVNVEDRLSLSNDFALSAADLVTLAGQGIDASDISQFRFFTNQFETDTTGLDLVATTETEWLNGVTTWNFALNMTTTEVSDRDPALFGADRVRLVQDGTPGTRWNVTANHNVDQWRFLARINYYGEYYDNEAGGFFDDAVLLDLEAAYSVNEDMTITVGGRNVSDEQGCSTAKCGGTPPGALGLPYSQFSPFGFNGAFYYGRFTYNFK
ncbi:MAG: TonB-dependent receptor [Gammaproteobacteria bacterium]|nr:TonB-dependent receptor [Gammaproteobacteria bacterium]